MKSCLFVREIEIHEHYTLDESNKKKFYSTLTKSIHPVNYYKNDKFNTDFVGESMVRGPLFHENYKPQFTGHETFPMRYGWLKKAYDHVVMYRNHSDDRAFVWGDEAISQLGVGKNMVSSIRYWSKLLGVIGESAKAPHKVKVTDLGQKIFGKKGIDPFMENPTTLWLIHWKLVSNINLTTWYWTFGYYPSIVFDRFDVQGKLERLCADRNWKRTSSVTLKNDISVFIRTYSSKFLWGGGRNNSVTLESNLECPLTELGLIKPTGKNDGFRFVKGEKSSLGMGVFTAALLDYWRRYSPTSATLSFETVAHQPGCCGRLFLLYDNDVVDRLSRLEAFTKGALRWSETAGLKQVIKTEKAESLDEFSLISKDFKYRQHQEAA